MVIKTIKEVDGRFTEGVTVCYYAMLIKTVQPFFLITDTISNVQSG
jgi:hypothetical protein